MNDNFEIATFERWNILLDIISKHKNIKRSKLLQYEKMLKVKKNFFNMTSKQQAYFICRAVELI